MNRVDTSNLTARLALMLLLALPASAAEPDTYPMMSSLNLPAGAASLALPATVVAGDSEALAQTLRLQDSTGREVPFAILTSESPDEGQVTSVSWEPMTPPEGPAGMQIGAWWVGASDVPLDALRFDMADLRRGPWVVRLYAEGTPGGEATWVQVGQEQFLYGLHAIDGATSTRDRVRLPHARGPFKVVIIGERPPVVASIEGLAITGHHVEPVSEEVQVAGPVYTEDGAARYTLDLSGPRAVSGLTLHVSEPIFSRAVTVSAGESDARGRNSSSQLSSQPIARAMIGDVQMDETSIRGIHLTTDRLVVEVQGGRDEPLTLSGATVESVGALLLAPDAGAAPHTLYFGGTEPDAASDVAIAADEIARVATRYAGGPLSLLPNPEYVPHPTREGLDGVAAPINLALWKWERPIVADPGWTRIMIDGAVLLHAQPGLADLRVVDRDGRNVPYDVRPASTEVEVPLGEMKRVEQGETSDLSFTLPADVGVVRRIELDTDATTFSRRVDIVRDRGSLSETLRSVDWIGIGSPHRLCVDLNEPLGAALMVRIHNGDDPPLRVTGVHAWTRGSELRTNVPEGGARLVYGNRRAEPPSFDLALLSSTIGAVPTHPGTLGPETAGAGVAMTLVDQGLVAVGFGALGLGLVALLIGALRPVKAAPAATSPPGSPSPGETDPTQTAGPPPPADPATLS